MRVWRFLRDPELRKGMHLTILELPRATPGYYGVGSAPNTARAPFVAVSVLNNLSSHGTELVREFGGLSLHAASHLTFCRRVAGFARAGLPRGDEVIVLNSENGKTRNVPFSSGSSKVPQCAFCTFGSSPPRRLHDAGSAVRGRDEVRRFQL